MAIFRSIFCGVFCALMFCGASWGAGCYTAWKNVTDYKSGDVSKFLNYDCVSKNGESVPMIVGAVIGIGECPGNEKIAKAMLDQQPELANSEYLYGKQTLSVLEGVISGCCISDGLNEYRGCHNKNLKKNHDKMAELLIEHHANIDRVVDQVANIRGSERKIHGTLLDYVRFIQQSQNCQQHGRNFCVKIEDALVKAGAKTYAELNGETIADSASGKKQLQENKTNTKNNVAPAPSPTRTSVPQTQSTETANTANTEQTVKTNAAEPVNAQASVASIDNDDSNKTDAGAVAVGDAVAVSTTITPQSEKGNTTEKDSEVKVEQVSEKEEISSDAEESSAGSGADNKGDAPIAAAAVQGRIASVHDGVIQQNINPTKVTACRPCAGNYGVICRDKKVGDECVYETKCQNPDWKLFNNGQWDAYCEEPPQLGASMAQPRNVSCSEEELNSINAVMGTKNSNGKCEPIVCKIDYEIKDNTCVKQECTDAQLHDLNAASGFIENEVCIPKDCLANFKLVGGKCVDAAELEKQMQDAESAYDDALTRETSLENRLWSAGAMAATGLGSMELARGLAEKKADEKAEADMAAYMETFRCEVGNDKNILGQTKNITTPGANQLINLYQSYVDLAASLKQRKADLGLRPGIEAEVVLDKSVVGLYDDKGNGVQNGTYASLYRAKMGSEADKQKLDTQSNASTRRVGIGGTVAGGGAVLGAYKNIKINGDSVDSDSGVLNQAAGLFLGK